MFISLFMLVRYPVKLNVDPMIKGGRRVYLLIVQE